MKNSYKAMTESSITALVEGELTRYTHLDLNGEIVESRYKGKTYFFLRYNDLEKKAVNYGVKFWSCEVGTYNWLEKSAREHKNYVDVWNRVAGRKYKL
jgi:hypothetical protein